MRARIARSTAAPPTLQHQPHPSSSFCCDAADPLCCSSARERGPSSGRKPQQHKPLQQQLQRQLLLLLLLQLIGEAAAISVRHPSARSFGFVSGPLGGPLPWSARKGVFNGVRGASQLSGLGALWKGGDHRDTVTATGAPGGPSGTFLEGGQEAPELCLALETSCDDPAAAVVSRFVSCCCLYWCCCCGCLHCCFHHCDFPRVPICLFGSAAVSAAAAARERYYRTACGARGGSMLPLVVSVQRQQQQHTERACCLPWKRPFSMRVSRN